MTGYVMVCLHVLLCSPCVCVCVRYGMHESFDYYLDCRLRQRNQGLFTADRVCHKLLMLAILHLMLPYSAASQAMMPA